MALSVSLFISRALTATRHHRAITALVGQATTSRSPFRRTITRAARFSAPMPSCSGLSLLLLLATTTTTTITRPPVRWIPVCPCIRDGVPRRGVTEKEYKGHCTHGRTCISSGWKCGGWLPIVAPSPSTRPSNPRTLVQGQSSHSMHNGGSTKCSRPIGTSKRMAAAPGRSVPPFGKSAAFHVRTLHGMSCNVMLLISPAVSGLKKELPQITKAILW